MQNSANYMGLPDVPMSWFVDYVKTAVGARLDLIQSPDEKISSPVVKERLKNALREMLLLSLLRPTLMEFL